MKRIHKLIAVLLIGSGLMVMSVNAGYHSQRTGGSTYGTGWDVYYPYIPGTCTVASQTWGSASCIVEYQGNAVNNIGGDSYEVDYNQAAGDYTIYHINCAYMGNEAFTEFYW